MPSFAAQYCCREEIFKRFFSAIADQRNYMVVV